MITLTLNVPNVGAVLAAGFDTLVVGKSTTQTAAGPYTDLAATVLLVSGTTAYTYADPLGGPGDWYASRFRNSGTAQVSNYGPPEPAYMSDLLNTVRDLLGVTTVEAPDAVIQGFAYLPTALAHARQRLPTFDTLVSAGGDPSAACLGALANYTAALLCPRMTVQVLDSEQFDRYRLQRNRQMDWTAVASALMATYEVLISEAAGETADSTDMWLDGLVMAGPTTSGAEDTSGGLASFASNNPYENPMVPFDPNWDPNH